jgi:hypothetical protein
MLQNQQSELQFSGDSKIIHLFQQFAGIWRTITIAPREPAREYPCNGRLSV